MEEIYKPCKKKNGMIVQKCNLGRLQGQINATNS